MSLLQATLTCRGSPACAVAGIAVDANVLIHERIREEVRNARGRDGDRRRLPGRVRNHADSHLTTIISSAFLLYFGSGTVKGFAVTLILGRSSRYSPLSWLRVFHRRLLRHARPQVLPI